MTAEASRKFLHEGGLGGGELFGCGFAPMDEELTLWVNASVVSCEEPNNLIRGLCDILFTKIDRHTPRDIPIRFYNRRTSDMGACDNGLTAAGEVWCVVAYRCHSDSLRCGLNCHDRSRLHHWFNCGVIRTIQEQKSPHTADGAQDEHTNDEPQDQSTSYERAIIDFILQRSELVWNNRNKSPYPAIKNQ